MDRCARTYARLRDICGETIVASMGMIPLGLRRFLVCAAITTASMGLSQQAQAATSSHIERPFGGKRDTTLDLHIGGNGYWGGGLALGARLSLPIVHNGFAKSINNSVNIVVGFDFLYARWFSSRLYNYGRIGFHMPLLLNWTFYFSKELGVFAELGPAFTFFPRYRDYEPRYRDAYGFFAGGIGLRYMVSDKFGVVARLGSPTMSLGVSIAF